MYIFIIATTINFSILFSFFHYFNRIIKKNSNQLINRINDTNDILTIKINNIGDIINDINNIINNIHNTEYVENYRYSKEKLIIMDKMQIINHDIEVINMSIRKLIDNYNIHEHIHHNKFGITVQPKIK